jgi:hypothetical protein
MAKDNEISVSQLVDLCRNTDSEQVTLSFRSEEDRLCAAVIAVSGLERVVRVLNAVSKEVGH